MTQKSSKEFRTAMIGIGRWGKNIARELDSASNLAAYVSNGSPENVAWASEHIPGAAALTIDEVCDNSSIEAVVVATPIDTHAQIVERLLAAKKHVLVEKPMAKTATEAEHLARLAEKNGVVLATGYVFLSHPVYEELRRIVPADSIRSIACTWKKYGTFEESIEENLLTHHLALAYDMFGMPHSGKIKRGAAVLSQCDQLDVSLDYGTKIFTSSIDRTSSARSHTIEITCTDGAVFLWDGNTLSVRKHDQPLRVIFENNLPPLRVEITAFLEAIRTGDVQPLRTSGLFGSRVLALHDLLSEESEKDGHPDGVSA